MRIQVELFDDDGARVGRWMLERETKLATIEKLLRRACMQKGIELPAQARLADLDVEVTKRGLFSKAGSRIMD